MIALVRIALRRPYTFVVLALVIFIVGPLAALRTPVDIFPDIRIPVIAVIWQYTGLPPDQMAGRITTQFQRALTTTVNDIEHMEATSYNTLSITKIFFQPNVDIRIANAQVTAISQTLLKQMPPGATPPLILNYNASTVPIIQLALSGQGLSEQILGDLGLNVVRTPLVTVPGAAIPLPYGGKLRQIQIDLDSMAMQARGLSGQDVANALAAQNHSGRHAEDRQLRILDSAQQRALRNRRTGRSADQGREWRNGLCPRCGPGARWQPAADEHRACRRQSFSPHAGAEERISLDARNHLRHQGKAGTDQTDIAARARRGADRRSVGVRPRGGERRHYRGHHSGRPHEHHDPYLSWKLAFDGHHRNVVSALDPWLDRSTCRARRDAQHHDLGRTCARRRHSRRRRDRDDREYQLASRARQGSRCINHGWRCTDCDAGFRVATLYLHRVRTDVLPARCGALSFRTDGGSGHGGNDLFLHPVAHAGAADGELSSAKARTAHRYAWPGRSAAALAQSAGSFPARV